ncbi:sigma-70 family RNA polymerase sigma factor [Mycetocola tolaasinivorans]|uniref:Sigma-70 family RNA polymerase sigma factor n=1 Tax=Mycetocola tolaasinivorans TaxID=76635 RepID=A0A3L7A422_9MICO|nr:sigma-70 family RNA polymerase sigma factor [Mycetocola tolaasinivorans]RLP74805.1 sigma-70 family RNA polymerase sigma factor [Mycetocola tolaasinivorans]
MTDTSVLDTAPAAGHTHGPPDPVDALRAGDRSAFDRIYRTHGSAVYRYAWRMLGSEQDAEELTQDVFVLAWGKRTTIRVVDTSVLPWLLVACRNLGLNRIRSRGAARARFAESLDERTHPAVPSAEQEALDAALATEIQAAVEELSGIDQMLYHLCLDEGISYDAAARALGTTTGVVRNRLSRLRQKLRLRLSPIGENS